MTPVFKSGDRSDPSNYRPISLLSSISKILEHFVFTRLNLFFEKNGIIPEFQYGFRSGRSTQDATSVLADTLLEAKDNKLCSGAVFLDVRKAFDTVDHARLLSKLWNCGVNGNVHLWLSNYLSDRSQFVQVGEDASACCRCLRGVPQGSKLGPLLYNFYTSDLPSSNLTSSIILYADDVCLMTSHTSYSGVVKSLQHDVSLLSSWYDRNLMKLNGKKTQLMLFRKFRDSTDLSNFSISVDGSTVSPTNSARYLGVIFDVNLSWRPQVDSVVKKVSRKLGALYRARSQLNAPARVAFVRSIIQPDVDYCSVVWDSGSHSISSRLRQIDKRCLRLLAGIRFREPTGDLPNLFNRFNLHSFDLRHQFSLGVHAFRGIASLTSSEISSRFCRTSSGDHDTRLSRFGLHLTRPSTNALRSTSFYRAQLYWNSLGPLLWSAADLKTFKVRLRFNCYSVQEK